MRILVGLLVLAFVSVLARSTADNLPRSFTKHGEVWTIRYVTVVDSDPSNDAMTYCGFKRIDVRKNVQGRELAKTFMHEIEHVLGCENGWANDQKWNNSNDKEDGCEGHCGIYWSSEELLAFIQDNPEFITFLEQAK